MRRYVALLVTTAFLFGSLAADIRATTITDDFSASHDYLTGGVSGTIWSGLMNAGSATALDANTSNAGRLTMSLGGYSNFWPGDTTNAPFLYTNVDTSGDFTVQVKVAAPFAANNAPGLMVYKDNNNFITLQTRYYEVGDGSAHPSTISVLNGSAYNGPSWEYSAYNANAPMYLKLGFTSATDTYKCWSSSDGVTWTPEVWQSTVNWNDPNVSYPTDLVRSDMTGPLKVGLAFADWANTTPTATFSNFSLTTVPEPGAIVLLVTGLLGLLAYAWRKRR